MDTLKKSALGVCVTLLFIALFVFGLAFGLYKIFGTPDAIKSALKDSGIYQSVVGDVLDQAQKEQPRQGQNDIPVTDPAVQNVIKGAVSPEILQAQTEKALDSAYAWLQGKTPKLEFVIELGDVKQNLANGLEQYVMQRAAALPACAPGTPPSSDIDPFSATCLPQGFDAAQLAAEARNQILNGEFLKENTLTAADLKGGDGKSIEQQLAAAPAAYKKLSLAVYGTGLLALLLAVATVLLSVNWRSGLKKVSIIFIIIGSISAVLSWLASFGAGRAEEFAKEPLQQSGVKVAQYVANDLRDWWLWYGITLVAAGIVALIVLRATKSKDETEAGGSAEPTGEALPERPAGEDDRTKPADKKQPKPVKKLVQ